MLAPEVTVVVVGGKRANRLLGPLARVTDAPEHMGSGHPQGKIVVTV